MSAAAPPSPGLRPRVVCDKCEKPPRLRVPPEEVALAAMQRPETVKSTYQCHTRGCGHIYPVTARAYQEARP